MYRVSIPLAGEQLPVNLCSGKSPILQEVQWDCPSLFDFQKDPVPHKTAADLLTLFCILFSSPLQFGLRVAGGEGVPSRYLLHRIGD